MNLSVKLFGQEPALVGAFLQSILALLLGLGIVPGLDPHTAALVSVAGAALFGAYAAYAIKQNLLPAIVAAFQATVAVGIGFGLGDVLTAHGYDPSTLTGLVTAVLVGGLGMFLRKNADPKAGSPAQPDTAPPLPSPPAYDVVPEDSYPEGADNPAPGEDPNQASLYSGNGA